MKSEWYINVTLNTDFEYSFIIVIQYYILKGKTITTCGLHLQELKHSKQLENSRYYGYSYRHREFLLQQNMAYILNSQLLNS